MVEMNKFKNIVGNCVRRNFRYTNISEYRSVYSFLYDVFDKSLDDLNKEFKDLFHILIKENGEKKKDNFQHRERKFSAFNLTLVKKYQPDSFVEYSQRAKELEELDTQLNLINERKNDMLIAQIKIVKKAEKRQKIKDEALFIELKEIEESKRARRNSSSSNTNSYGRLEG